MVLAGTEGVVVAGLDEKPEAAGTAAGVDPGLAVLHEGQLVFAASLMQKQPGHSQESALGLNWSSEAISSILSLRPLHGSTV